MLLKETVTSICNKALALLGEEPINSLDDKSTRSSRLCKQFYDLALRSTLEMGKWPFATIEEPIERYQIKDYVKEQKYVYHIPTNAALVIGLTKRWNRKKMRKHIDWDVRYIPELRERAIICNLESTTSLDITEEIDQDEQILIEYIDDNQETTSYTAMFVRCVAAQLAADLAMPLTHDTQKFGTMMQLAESLRSQALMQALNEDGQDKEHWVDPITASRGW
jgi:hypothetical protein